MSTGSDFFPAAPDPTARSFAACAPPAEDAPEQPSLAQLTQTCGLASVADDLQDAVERLRYGPEDMAEKLAENVSRLQESFLDSLYACLERAAVDTGAKLTVCLDADGRLRVRDGHPDGERVNRALADAGDLAAAFAEIADQCSVLRDIRSLRSLLARRRAPGSADAAGLRQDAARYRLSLKGDMNHFYFSGC